MPCRVLLIHTGGTFGMAPSGHPASLAPSPSLDRLFEQVPELSQLAEFKLRIAFNQDSSANEPDDILALGRLIRQEIHDCAGAVVIHGTDTMAFTASVLGFLLADLGKPVVLTGSQRPLAYVRSDARSNLVDAVELALSGVAEVGICFGDHWLRGVAADKLSVHRYEAFHSPNLPPLAELGLNIQFHPHAGTFPRQVPPGLGSRLELGILVVTPHPGMPWVPPADLHRGVLIQAYGAGNLPMDREDLQAFLGGCLDRGLPVVATSQCPWGGVELGTYAMGQRAAEAGVISGGRHTRWCALAKLGLLLGAGATHERIREAFTGSWAGEPI